MRKGTVHIHSIDGNPMNTNVCVWTGEAWVAISGVQSVQVTAAVGEPTTAFIHVETVASDIELPPDSVTWFERPN